MGRADTAGYAMREGSRVGAGGLLRVMAVWMALLPACGALCSAGSLQSGEEYHVKALFLYAFTKFVEWPSDMPGDALCIGIVGDDPFGDILDQTVAGKTVNGRGFVVKRFKSDAEARLCHIVFVGASETKRMRAVLDALKGSGVLTVGEARGFAQAGGVINFEIVDNKVRFEVNIEAAKRARLKLSSKLLSLAKIVRDASD